MRSKLHSKLHSKLNLPMLVALLVGVALLSGDVALAAANKVELAPPDGSESEASGQAVINFSEEDEKTIVNVNVSGLAEGEFEVFMTAEDGEHSAGALSVKKNGKGHVNLHLEGDHSGHLPIVIKDADGNVVLQGS